MKKTLILLITSALSACTVGPDYAAPALDLPEWWHNSEAQKTPDGKNWWTNFHDEKLNELIDQALKSNHTVKIAEARIAEARASREQTASGL
jgi:outer membrane protein TolC